MRMTGISAGRIRHRYRHRDRYRNPNRLRILKHGRRARGRQECLPHQSGCSRALPASGVCRHVVRHRVSGLSEFCKSLRGTGSGTRRFVNLRPPKNRSTVDAGGRSLLLCEAALRYEARARDAATYQETLIVAPISFVNDVLVIPARRDAEGTSEEPSEQRAAASENSRNSGPARRAGRTPRRHIPLRRRVPGLLR